MIYGLTHDEEGVVKKSSSFCGKIAAGLPSYTGTNQTNHPIALDYYNIMIKKSKNVAGSIIDKWFVNDEVQEKVGKKPKILEFFAMGKSVDDIWSATLQQYTSGGLICQGNGRIAKRLFIDREKKEWREIPCLFRACEFFINGDCSASGRLVVNLAVDPHVVNPYRFDTGSINGIMSISSELNEAFGAAFAGWTLTGGKKRNGNFMGLYGMKLRLALKRKKSGGRMIYYSTVTLAAEEDKKIVQIMIGGAESQQNLMIENTKEPLLITDNEVEDSQIVDDGSQIAEIIELENNDMQMRPGIQGHEDTEADQKEFAEEFRPKNNIEEKKTAPAEEWGSNSGADSMMESIADKDESPKTEEAVAEKPVIEEKPAEEWGTPSHGGDLKFKE